MLKKEEFNIFNFIKKDEYVGSISGMRYMFKKKALGDCTTLEVIIWPEPLGYAKTPEDKKQRMDFTFSQEGLEESIDWLNEQYKQPEELWVQ